ncbi:hypothetical protein QMA80_07960 [Burkholderia pseudomallei]|uniref:hypothetical protein n=1 Tax=Burkholderia pseudomallei TaxID=28450 RepID=UPI002DBD10E5|nr:hypothetical protein [Burkholderia pseudomallei]MEB5483844.1 hypothetical protein [Burkholderia pseudomallei]MEB5490896.1 hypothetical protein [Burkholderia pseudomallei]MEB5496877.1 hypothetical protein [Burkholderia pseudomallei]MEB5510249.1 hypothetical protein [Burkholderia pseudomallei]
MPLVSYQKGKTLRAQLALNVACSSHVRRMFIAWRHTCGVPAPTGPRREDGSDAWTRIASIARSITHRNRIASFFRCEKRCGGRFVFVSRRPPPGRPSPIAAHAAALSRIRARARRMARIRFEPHEASRATSGDDRTRVERCCAESAHAHPADPVDMKRQLYEECAERRQSFVSRARQWWRRARCACADRAIGTVKAARR